MSLGLSRPAYIFWLAEALTALRSRGLRLSLAEASALVWLATALALVDIDEGHEPHGYQPSGHTALTLSRPKLRP